MRTDHILAITRHFDTATLPAIDAAIAEYRGEMLRLMAIREVICMALPTEKIEQPGGEVVPPGVSPLKLAMERVIAAEQMEAAE